MTPKIPPLEQREGRRLPEDALRRRVTFNRKGVYVGDADKYIRRSSAHKTLFDSGQESSSVACTISQAYFALHNTVLKVQKF